MASPARLTGFLLLAALLGWALWEARWTPALPAPPDSVAQPDATPLAAPLAFAPLSDYPATLSRPLFFAGRRAPGQATGDTPDATGDGTAPTPTGGTSRLSLSAVIEEGDQRSALLSVPGQGPATRVRVGEQIGGWRLVGIADDGVTVEADGRREQIPLRHFGAGTVRVTPTPSAPPQPRLFRPAAGGGGAVTPE